MGTLQSEIAFEITGNPFVDTGLRVLAALADLDDVSELTIEAVKRVHDDGDRIAGWNESLRCFTMLFTSNSLLTNPSIKNKTLRTNLYKAALNGLLLAIGSEEMAYRCESCGHTRSLDFDGFCRKALSGVEAQDNGRFVGRDWFPLSGSPGSDAQALPAASRSVHLCAKCLFAVHYMPLGVILLDGLLAVFQCTSNEFGYELIRDICHEMKNRISGGLYEMIGAKEGSSALVHRLIALLNRLRAAGRLAEIDRGAALYAWRFTNSGQPPKDGITCQIEEIPNSALRFLSKAMGHGFGNEITALLAKEGRRDRELLRCISEGRDYPSLYPKGASRGASPGFFALYQAEILGKSSRALWTARTLAQQAHARSNPGQFKRLLREGLNEGSVRNQFRGWMVELAEHGDFTHADYTELFPPEDDTGLSVRPHGWKLIDYYLHQVGHTSEHGEDPLGGANSIAPNGPIHYYALRFFEDYVRRRGRERFRADVLARMGRGEIGLPWLRTSFTRLAENAPGFTYGAYEALCSRRGNPGLFREFLFQMRLFWTEWMKDEASPSGGEPLTQHGSGLANSVEDLLTKVFVTYTSTHGLGRFRENVLSRLRRRETGLSWFRRVLTGRAGTGLSVGEWEEFLKDEEGRPCVGERLLQMNLLMANLWRESNA